MLYMLVFLFILNGHVTFEKKAFKSADECSAAGPKRQNELELDPAVDGLLFGACIPEPAQAVRK